MNVLEVIRNARDGQVPSVCLLVGTETLLIERAVHALRAATVSDGVPGFNEDVLYGKGLTAERVLSIARTVPMMAARRFVLVRRVDEMSAEALDALADYLENAIDSTCFVATAEKLDGRTRFARAAKKTGCIVEVEALKGAALSDFVASEAKGRGHAMPSTANSALVDAIGSDLCTLDDAIERLSLYVGEGKPITVGDVEQCVTRVRVDSIWTLVDGVSTRDAKRVLSAAASLLNDREPALRILAMVARQLRMIARMREALANGLNPPEAAKHAGAPPFKAEELMTAAKRFTMPDLSRAFRILSETDIALKGSKRASEVVLEEALLRLTRADPTRSASVD